MKQLLLPPGGLFTLAFSLFLAARLLGLRAQWPATISVIVAYLACTPLVGETTLSWHQTSPPLSAADLRVHAGGPDAIVILSAGLRGRTEGVAQPRLDGLSIDRLLYGADLAKRTDLPVLVTGGPWGPHDRPIALEMRSFLRHWTEVRVPWTEIQARNTWENARHSADMLSAAGITRVYLVTHAWHMPRAAYAFRTHGIEVVPAPTGFIRAPQPSRRTLLPAPSGVQTSYWALHELLGIIAYRLFKTAPKASNLD